jgi:hypothetical protein
MADSFGERKIMVAAIFSVSLPYEWIGCHLKNTDEAVIIIAKSQSAVNILLKNKPSCDIMAIS